MATLGLETEVVDDAVLARTVDRFRKKPTLRRMLPGEKLEARRMEDLRQAITAHLRGGSSQLTSELWPNLYSPHR